jgi:general secretion pathway protein E
MTGHLVFSTLHTNSALGTLGRLLDMGIDNFLISSSIIGIVGQRLVRQLCPHCKEGVKLRGHELREFDLEPEKEYFIYRAVGCKKCKNTGYAGRTVVAEILNVDEKIRELINKNESTMEIKKILKNMKIKSIIQDGLDKILRGITSLEEVLRVVQDEL